MFSALERLVGAVVDREGTAEFVALSRVVRKRLTFSYKVVTESYDTTSNIYYPDEEAKPFDVNKEANVWSQFPHAILIYQHGRDDDDGERIVVHARNKPPAPKGTKVDTQTVYIGQLASEENIKSNASQIVNLLSKGYAYEGDVEVNPKFTVYGGSYPLELVLRDPKQRTWREWASGTNKQPQG